MEFSFVQLSYIIALDQYKNFAKAAEKCMVTQPTLSMQIKKMEDSLGIIIFDRSKQPIVHTEIGKIIIDQARVILREKDKIEELILMEKKTLSGSLKIAVIPTIAPYLLPLFLGKIMVQYPNLKLEIQEKKTDEIIHLLKNDEIDVGVLSTPTAESQIIEMPLYYEEIKVYSDGKHPFIKLDILAPEQLIRKDIWMLSEGNCFRNQVINLCAIRINKRYENRLNYQSGSLETLKKFVDSEGGFTLLPELAILEMPNRQMNQVKQLNPPAVREIGLVYVRNVAKLKWINILANIIKEAIPKEMLDKKRGKLVEWK
jgi:LysR family hydrogen peroxide-inducible transcriptional activator